MKEKIDNEFKPRTWLLGILIFIALVIVVILINKIVLVVFDILHRLLF